MTATINFQNFSFNYKEGEDIVKVTYAKRYGFEIPLSHFTSIDHQVEINSKEIIFPNESESVAERKIDRIIDEGLHNLMHKLNGKKVVYIDERSGIPLIGSSDFGIIDRNTSLIEVKTMTGCNLNCIYCSVDEGVNNKLADYLIDPYYLAEVASERAATKKHPVEFNINPHGEPLLYPFMYELVEELAKIPNCNSISTNTNGTLLSKEVIDKLKAAGLTRINLSLNTLDPVKLDKLSGKKYPTKHVLEMVEYCKEIKMPILLAPVIVPGYNDNIKNDIEPIIKLAKSIPSPYPTVGFQNFLPYKGGRNPVKKEKPFEEFFAALAPFEEKYDMVLTPKKDYNPFGIFEDTKLEKPMKKNQVVKAKIVARGRVPNERLVVAHDRAFVARGVHKDKGVVTLKLVRDKHNIFLGVPV